MSSTSLLGTLRTLRPAMRQPSLSTCLRRMICTRPQQALLETQSIFQLYTGHKRPSLLLQSPRSSCPRCSSRMLSRHHRWRTCLPRSSSKLLLHLMSILLRGTICSSMIQHCRSMSQPRTCCKSPRLLAPALWSRCQRRRPGKWMAWAPRAGLSKCQRRRASTSRRGLPPRR